MIQGLQLQAFKSDYNYRYDCSVYGKPGSYMRLKNKLNVVSCLLLIFSLVSFLPCLFFIESA